MALSCSKRSRHRRSAPGVPSGTQQMAGKNRLHLDRYPTGRDNTLPMRQRIEIVEARPLSWSTWARPCSAGPDRTTRTTVYFVVMNDPEGNDFCVG
jgi:hypothetical protein